MVIGNDLRNEIRVDLFNKLVPTWGDKNVETDWKLTATNAANQVLQNNPNLLIFIEGLNYANDMSHIRDSPIILNVAGKLVYSWHMYSWEHVASLTDYESFTKTLNTNVGYILESD